MRSKKRVSIFFSFYILHLTVFSFQFQFSVSLLTVNCPLFAVSLSAVHSSARRLTTAPLVSSCECQCQCQCIFVSQISGYQIHCIVTCHRHSVVARVRVAQSHGVQVHLLFAAAQVAQDVQLANSRQRFCHFARC